MAESDARTALKRYGGIRALANLSMQDLRESAGLEGFEALRTLALIELGRRAANASENKAIVIGDPDAVMHLLDHLRLERQEHFVAILLDAKNQVIRQATIHIGTLTSSVVGAREVFREAIRDGACSLIVAHNHPSGDPTPSPEDISVTKKLVEIGKMLDIPVLDHVIIGERRSVSMHQRGLIDQ